MTVLVKPVSALAVIAARALTDPRAQTLLMPGELLHDADPADRRYPASDDVTEFRIVTDLYEHDGHQLGRRLYFRDHDDDTIDLAFVALLGDWSDHSIPNMLTLGDGLLMVGRGVFVYAGHDGDDVVYTSSRLAEVK